MESIIELQRQNHEEIERFQRALTGLLSQSAPTHKQALSNEHKAAQILDRVQTRYLDLHRQYSDQDARRQELESLSAPASNQQGDLSQFYARLVKIQEHHRKYPDSVVDGFQLELAGILDPGAAQADGEEVEEVDRMSLKPCVRPGTSLISISTCIPIRRGGGIWSLSRPAHQLYRVQQSPKPEATSIVPPVSRRCPLK
jgi:hypothetical protein